MKSGYPGTEIRYTLDGSDPVKSGGIYSGPLTLDKSSDIKAVAFLNGQPLSGISEKKVLLHLASGKPVTYKNPYSDKYPGGGMFALVNGIRGTINLTDGTWQGFEGNDLDAEIDLGSVQTVKKLSLGTLQSNGSWIFFPSEVVFTLTADKAGPNTVLSLKNSVDPKDGSRQTHEFTAEIQPTQARFIHVIARNIGKCPPWHAGKGSPAWLFVDEIIVE